MFPVYFSIDFDLDVKLTTEGLISFAKDNY